MGIKESDRLSFERTKLKNEMAKERQRNADKLRRERMAYKDKLDQKKHERKIAEDKLEEQRAKKAARKKFFKAATPHLPKRKKQGGRISRNMRIKLL
jgi:hypothetical protein